MKVYITGVSGTGKTSIYNELKKRGIYAISIDETEGLCSWINKESGVKVDYEAELNREFVDIHDWVCDCSFLKQLMNNHEKVVVLGLASNQDEFLDMFDKVLLLRVKPETFIKRIEGREDNDFGKDKDVQKDILSWYRSFEERLVEKGAISINTEKPIDEVVNNILNEL